MLTDVVVDLRGEAAVLDMTERVNPGIDESHTSSFEVTINGARSDDDSLSFEASVDGAWVPLEWRSVQPEQFDGVVLVLPNRSRIVRWQSTLDPATAPRGAVRFFEPTAFIGVDIPKGQWPEAVRVLLPPSLKTHWLGVAVTARLSRMSDPIQKVLKAIKDERLEGSIPTVSFAKITTGLNEVADTLRTIQEEVQRLGERTYAPGADVGAFERAADGVSAAIGQVSGTDPTVAQMVARLEKVVESIHRLPMIRWAVPETQFKLPRGTLLELAELNVPVSPAPKQRATTGPRLGTTAALSLLALGLLLLAWRLNGPWLVASQTVKERAKAISAGQDAIVAFLLVFPALIVTQLDRTPPAVLPGRVVFAKIRMALNLSVAIPITVSVLAIGTPLPRALTAGLLIGASILALNALVSFLFASGRFTLSSHRRVAMESRI